MKELSVILRVKPVRKMKKEEYIFFADYFSFIPANADSNSGKLFDCSQSITIETPDIDTLKEFECERYAIIYLQDSSGKDIMIGTEDIPALVSISANLNTATLKISCKMLHSPFSAA